MTPEEAGRKLGESLLLGERGQLVLVICEHEDELREIVRRAYDRVSGERGEPEVHWLWKETLYEPPFNRMPVLTVLDRLEQILHAPGPAPLLMVLPALTAARVDGDPASWRWLFQRLNERRNNILGPLHGALAIALTPAGEADFSEAAPDLWSVRSDVFRLIGTSRTPIVERGVHAAGPNHALVNLLLSLFSSSELRRLLRYMPGGEVLSLMLPSQATSPAEFTLAAVEALEHMGLLNETFFNRLRLERPRRATEIDRIERETLGVDNLRLPVLPPQVDEELLQNIAFRLHPTERAEIAALAGMDGILPPLNSPSAGFLLVQEMARQNRLKELARLMAEVAPETVRRVTRQP